MSPGASSTRVNLPVLGGGCRFRSCILTILAARVQVRSWMVVAEGYDAQRRFLSIAMKVSMLGAENEET